MTPAELLAALRERGVVLRDDGGSLRVAPASALTDEQRALLCQHAPELLALLRAPRPRDELVVELEVDAVLRAEEEASDRALRALVSPSPPGVAFRMRRGLVPLACLRPREVRRLEAAGKLSPDEVRQWARRRRWV